MNPSIPFASHCAQPVRALKTTRKAALQFKLMVWFQNEEKSRPTDKEGLWTEELLGFS